MLCQVVSIAAEFREERIVQYILRRGYFIMALTCNMPPSKKFVMKFLTNYG